MEVLTFSQKKEWETKHIRHKAVEGGTLIHWPQCSLLTLAQTASQHHEALSSTTATRSTLSY